MSRGIQPEILATFEEIFHQHGDLGEYLQAILTRHLSRDGYTSEVDNDLGFDRAHLDRATLLSFIETQNLRVAPQSTLVRAPAEYNNWSGNLSRNNSLDYELDAAIALSLEEVEEEDDAAIALSLEEVEDEDDAAIALSLEEVEEEYDSAIALSVEDVEEEEEEEEEDDASTDEQEDTSTELSDPVAEDDIDPDDMTFEDLESLEEAVGTESGGLSQELLDSFPVQKLKFKSGWFSSNKIDPEGCPICMSEYEVDNDLLTLPCLHLYHKPCIKEWLKHSKTCPVCNTDISVPQA